MKHMEDSDASMKPPPDAPGMAVFTMKQAAEVAGVSVSTLRRRRSDLEAAGAVISSEGWKVPITALEALGLIRSPAPMSVAPLAPTTPKEALESNALHEAQERIRELEYENLALRHRAEMAEAIARERAEALNAERMALRMIVASPSSSDNSQKEEKTFYSPAHQQQASSPAVRSSWWKRKFS